MRRRETRAIDLFSFEHVRVDGGHGPRLVDAHGAIPATGMTVVAGPSGSGKSTLLRLCNRLAVPTAGCVRHRGDDVATLDPLALRRSVGMLLQRPVPFPGTARENLSVADPHLDQPGAVRLLERVALPVELLDHPAHELSGGEAQRLCLARTLATEPRVLLMDEPTASLDDENARAIERLANDLVRDGVPVVWVTHDRDQLARIADTVLELREGCIVGSTEVRPRKEGDDAR